MPIQNIRHGQLTLAPEEHIAFPVHFGVKFASFEEKGAGAVNKPDNGVLCTAHRNGFAVHILNDFR
jgi:hypothetical protein